MQVLQTKNKKWFLEKRLIISPSRHLDDAVYCDETLTYSIMRNYFLVMDNYEEAHSYLMNCYCCFLRFHDNYMCKTHYVWINKDADVPKLNNIFGRGHCFIGKVDKKRYKVVREEIEDLNGRCIVIERDWFIKFRDSLVLACY